MIYTLGIDPGKQGGYALVDQEAKLFKYGLLDTSSEGFKDILLDCLDIADDQLQVNIEKPFLTKQSFNDVVFTNYGRILCNLELKNIEYKEIKPQHWLKYHGLKKTKLNLKPSRDFIQKKYPGKDFRKSARSKNIHDGITDAVCIALFGLEMM